MGVIQVEFELQRVRDATAEILTTRHTWLTAGVISAVGSISSRIFSEKLDTPMAAGIRWVSKWARVIALKYDAYP